MEWWVVHDAADIKTWTDKQITATLKKMDTLDIKKKSFLGRPLIYLQKWQRHEETHRKEAEVFVWRCYSKGDNVDINSKDI